MAFMSKPVCYPNESTAAAPLPTYVAVYKLPPALSRLDVTRFFQLAESVHVPDLISSTYIGEMVNMLIFCALIGMTVRHLGQFGGDTWAFCLIACFSACWIIARLQGEQPYQHDDSMWSFEV
ncbi:hypothetical protein SLS57_003904 [Botryosphaeria dothidea]